MKKIMSILVLGSSLMVSAAFAEEKVELPDELRTYSNCRYMEIEGFSKDAPASFKQVRIQGNHIEIIDDASLFDRSFFKLNSVKKNTYTSIAQLEKIPGEDSLEAVFKLVGSAPSYEGFPPALVKFADYYANQHIYVYTNDQAAIGKDLHFENRVYIQRLTNESLVIRTVQTRLDYRNGDARYGLPALTWQPPAICVRK